MHYSTVHNHRPMHTHTLSLVITSYSALPQMGVVLFTNTRVSLTVVIPPQVTEENQRQPTEREGMSSLPSQVCNWNPKPGLTCVSASSTVVME